MKGGWWIALIFLLSAADVSFLCVGWVSNVFAVGVISSKAPNDAQFVAYRAADFVVLTSNLTVVEFVPYKLCTAPWCKEVGIGGVGEILLIVAFCTSSIFFLCLVYMLVAKKWALLRKFSVSIILSLIFCISSWSVWLIAGQKNLPEFVPGKDGASIPNSPHVSNYLYGSTSWGFFASFTEILVLLAAFKGAASIEQPTYEAIP